MAQLADAYNYSAPMMTGRLPPEYIEYLLLLIRGHDISLRWSLDNESPNKTHGLFIQLVQDFQLL
jgi:hypothetical protein